MNLIETICKELGVAIGETWESIDGNSYCILSDGSITAGGSNRGYNYWEDIFKGLVRPKWRPSVGDIFYVPTLSAQGYNYFYWDGTTNIDIWYYDNNMVFKTNEEAVKFSNRLLGIDREEC